ncbi:MAG: NAD-dependent epimerase/dehydratase family protein [Armatimonadetes bacterium]|nr:NAD-dependent epimerase/dehydratase family protein [Armatimonadota bacterium]
MPGRRGNQNEGNTRHRKRRRSRAGARAAVGASARCCGLRSALAHRAPEGCAGRPDRPQTGRGGAGRGASVAHMAALLPGDYPPGDFVERNVKATATLLQAAVDRGVRRFVYCSTVWISGQGMAEPYLPIDEAVP